MQVLRFEFQDFGNIELNHSELFRSQLHAIEIGRALSGWLSGYKVPLDVLSKFKVKGPQSLIFENIAKPILSDIYENHGKFI